MSTFDCYLQPILQLPRLAAGLFLIGLALESSALTIGRPQGGVWIGKPLDVAVPLSLEGSDSDGSLCVTAELIQGDTPGPDPRVSVSTDPVSGSSTVIHVRSRNAIQEPVVTLNLRAGCDLKTSRSYVLLADVPSDAALPTVAGAPMRLPSDSPQAQARPTARNAARFDAGGSAASSNPASGGPSTPSRRSAFAQGGAPAADAPPAVRRPRPAPEAAPRRPAVVHAAAVPRAPAPAASAPVAATPPPAEPARDAAAGRPHLQLEALDPAAATVGSLKTSPDLKLPDAPDPARRAAAAALWSALDPAAGQARQDAQRAKDLEATLAVLREQAAQNQKTLLEMRSELAEARESRYSNPLVYALLVLLLLALIGLFMLWRLARRAAAPAWWGEAPLAPAAEAKRGRTTRGLLDDEMDLDPDGDDDPPARRGDPPRMFAPTPFAPLEPADAGPDSGPGEPVALPMHHADGTPIRQVNTEELFDVQQQSDFFLSLGQKDQAIAVLREHIADNPSTSALAYLDLMRIYHSMDRRDDYARLAEEFERAFNADVPDFEHFNETGRGLEYYRGALSRIESQWPAPGTLALIEELVFRKPGAGHDDGGFDLAAYQELLLLYSVAKEVIEPDAAAPAITVAPEGFADTISREWSQTATATLGPETAPPVVEGGPTLPPSLYGSIDHGLEEETVLSLETPEPMAPPVAEVPASPVPVHPVAPVAPTQEPETEMDLARFDRTAYETLLTPIEPEKPAPAADPHLIDFELFDPSTEAEIAPRPLKR